MQALSGDGYRGNFAWQARRGQAARHWGRGSRGSDSRGQVGCSTFPEQSDGSAALE